MDWNNTLQKALDAPLTATRKSELEFIFTTSLYTTQINMGVVILLFQALMILSALMRTGLMASPRRQAYLFLYIALFCATCIFMIRLRHFRRQTGTVSRQINLSFYYSLFLCVWSCFLTLMDQNTGANVSVFSYVMISMAVFSVLRPWQSLFLFGGGFVLLNTAAQLVQGNPLFYQEIPSAFNLLINSLFVALLAAITSITLYRYRLLNHHAHTVIQQQLDQISAINQQLEKAAMTDQLTGVGNRRFLNEQLQKMARCDHPQPVTGLMLDIDYFKQYNDCYGHQAGDQCLLALSALMQTFAQSEGAFVTRYGGEEFFLCLPNCVDPLGRADALRHSIEAAQLQRSDLPIGCVTVSIGVDTESDWTAIGQDAFLRRCDQALYAAKNSGRNRVCLYHAEINTDATT